MRSPRVQATVRVDSREPHQAVQICSNFVQASASTQGVVGPRQGSHRRPSVARIGYTPGEPTLKVPLHRTATHEAPYGLFGDLGYLRYPAHPFHLRFEVDTGESCRQGDGRLENATTRWLPEVARTEPAPSKVGAPSG